jgi:hypothetical protein
MRPGTDQSFDILQLAQYQGSVADERRPRREPTHRVDFIRGQGKRICGKRFESRFVVVSRYGVAHPPAQSRLKIAAGLHRQRRLVHDETSDHRAAASSAKCAQRPVGMGDDVDRTAVKGRSQTGDVIEFGFDRIACCIFAVAMTASIEHAGSESLFKKGQYGQPPSAVGATAVHEDDVWTGAAATV